MNHWADETEQVSHRMCMRCCMVSKLVQIFRFGEHFAQRTGGLLIAIIVGLLVHWCRSSRLSC